MKKRIVLLALLVLAVGTISACGTTTESTTTTTTTTQVALTSIAISGADDITLDYGVAFNVFTGVTATGNNNVDYTSEITFTTTSTSIATDGTLDTTVAGNVALRYQVTVGTVTSQHWRYITVNPQQAAEGEYLVNPDFSDGLTGWNDANVNYVADGAEMTLSVVDGALQAVVVAGSNAWTPRFGQMNVPFDNGVTYEISFRAKSSVEKTINLQVGELLSASPYFTDFKPGLTIHKTIGTEWATYSYKFTMNQEDTNHRGGVLFEMGTVGGNTTDATMWFDDITITVSTPDADTAAPTFTGVKEEVTVAYGGSYTPANVTAYDYVDGDVTEDIVITYEDADHNAIEAIDFNTPGIYYVVFTVEDEAGNIATESTKVTVKSLEWSDVNMISNPTFDDPLDETTPEWTIWSDQGTTGEIDNVNGVFNVTVTSAGSAAYSSQFNQDGILTLEQGKTYLFTFTVSASVDRTINAAIGWSNTTTWAWTEFAGMDDIAVTSTPTTYQIIFTVTEETHAVKVTFDLGNTTTFAAGVVTFHDVNLYGEAEETDSNYYSDTNLIVNPTFDDPLDTETPEWAMWVQNWGTMPTVVADIDNEAGTYDVAISDGGGDAAWAIQLAQDGITLEQGKTYRLQFTASATADRTINAAVGWTDAATNAWTQFGRLNAIALTSEATLYTLIFTVEPETHIVKVVFEMGTTDSFAEGTVSIYDVTLQEAVDFSDINMVTNPTFDDPLNTETPEWAMWVQNWGSMPTVVSGIDNEAGTYDVAISDGGGDAAWAIQLAQDGLTLEQGKTYLVQFTASATADRTINCAVGWTDAATNAWTQFGRLNAIALTSEATLYEFTFTVTPETHIVKIVFEMGTTDSFAEGTVSIYDVAIYENVEFQTTNLLVNGSFADALNTETPEWDMWVQNWGTMPTVVADIDTEDEVYNVNITDGGGDAVWAVQFFQDGISLEQGKTYKVVFSVSATAERTINCAVGWTDSATNAWTQFGRLNNIEIGLEETTYSFVFTVTPETHDVKLVFELGSSDGFAEGTVTFYEAAIYEAVAEVPAE